jgi:hypothetical protein
MSEQGYSKHRDKSPSRWDIFIACASKDKDDLVRSLANVLGLSIP